MNKQILPASILIASGAALAFPSAAFAGSRGMTNCSESFAKWHVSIEQPEGGYVTLDFGRDGVDYTTTVWQVTEMTPLGARFPGTTIRVLWHAADGTVLREKGNGVPVSVQDCGTTSTTQPPAPTTTIPAETTTAPPTTVPETTVPSTTTPEPVTVVETTVPGPADTLPPPRPGKLTNDTSRRTTVPVTNLVVTTFLLPATGPDQAGPTAALGTATLALGLALTALTRRTSRTRPARRTA